MSTWVLPSSFPAGALGFEIVVFSVAYCCIARPFIQRLYPSVS